MKKGKLIVIEGTDGSGKATQTELLVKSLKKEKQKVFTLDFPRYYSNLLGELIGECARGDHGDFAKLSPKIASVLYAVDRFESKVVMDSKLKSGISVVLDRYVSANQMHQGGKFSSARERSRFLDWLNVLEFEILNLPKPDIVIYLDVPVSISSELLKRSSKKLSQKKAYLKDKKDTLEHNIEYLKNSRKAALHLLASQKNWKKISCIQNGSLRSVEEIHGDVYELVSKLLS